MSILKIGDMENKLWYVLADPNSPTGLSIMSMVEYFDKPFLEIILPAQRAACDAFMADYTVENPYRHGGVKAAKEELIVTRLVAGANPAERVVVPGEITFPDSGMTGAEKNTMIADSAREAATLLHTTLQYCNIKETLNATITVANGDKYLLTFKPIK